MVANVAEQGLASARRKPAVNWAALVAPAAMLFAVGASAAPLAGGAGNPAPGDTASCCLQIVAAPAAAREDAVADPGVVPASRLRVVSRFLTTGLAPEPGLQVKTILASRSISEAFPQIHNIGGVRADGLRWHPNGLALDVMIPNPGSAEGIELGDRIVAFALDNAARFGLQDAIWRGMYYTPDGGQSGGYGHFDHVHITTIGGGYPTGNEVYLR